MSAHNGDAAPRMPLLRNGEGKEGALVSKGVYEIGSRCLMASQCGSPREVIFAAGLKSGLPVIFLSNLQGLRRCLRRAERQ